MAVLGLLLGVFIITQRGPAEAPPEYEVVPGAIGRTALYLGITAAVLLLVGLLLAADGHDQGPTAELRPAVKSRIAGALVGPFDAGLVMTVIVSHQASPDWRYMPLAVVVVSPLALLAVRSRSSERASPPSDAGPRV